MVKYGVTRDEVIFEVSSNLVLCTCNGRNLLTSSGGTFLWSHHPHRCVWWGNRRRPSLLLLSDFGTPSYKRPDIFAVLLQAGENSSGKISLSEFASLLRMPFWCCFCLPYYSVVFDSLLSFNDESHLKFF